MKSFFVLILLAQAIALTSSATDLACPGAVGEALPGEVGRIERSTDLATALQVARNRADVDLERKAVASGLFGDLSI